MATVVTVIKDDKDEAGAVPFSRAMKQYFLPSAVVLGAILRFGYAIVTPPKLRAHDYGGHFEYIKYVMEHGTIPLSQSGWEMHQAPLYYFGAALWGELTAGLQDLARLQRSLQFFDAILTVVTLWLMLLIGKELFRDEREKWKLCLYAAIIAVSPAMIYIASGTNNDALHQITSCMFLLALLKWWKSGTKNDWYGLSFATGVAFITKASSLIFLPVTFICLWFRDKCQKPKAKVDMFATYLIVVALISGWLFVLRASEDNKTRLLKLGNYNVMNASVVPTSIATFLTFRPAEVIREPYVNVFTPGKGREYFWEYFYKTIFYTSWPFRSIVPLASVLSATGLLAALLFLCGVLRDLKRGNPWNIPMMSTGVFLIASLIFYRTYQQYVANQDFRFITLLGPIMVYYAIRGVDALPAGMRHVGKWFLYGFAGLLLVWDIAVIATA